MRGCQTKSAVQMYAEQLEDAIYDADFLRARLAGIAEIIELVDQRASAVAGPITDEEMRQIYALASGGKRKA